MKSWLTEKDSGAGKDWRREDKGATEDEMVGWHHRFNGHKFEQAQRVCDGQESLVCCSPWGHKELDTTEWLKWTEHLEVTFSTRCFWLITCRHFPPTTRHFIVFKEGEIHASAYPVPQAMIQCTPMDNDSMYLQWFEYFRKVWITSYIVPSQQ